MLRPWRSISIIMLLILVYWVSMCQNWRVCVLHAYLIDEGSNQINFYIDGVIAVSELSPDGGVIVGTDHLAAVSFHPLFAHHTCTLIQPVRKLIVQYQCVSTSTFAPFGWIKQNNTHTNMSTSTHKCICVYLNQSLCLMGTCTEWVSELDDDWFRFNGLANCSQSWGSMHVLVLLCNVFIFMR